MLFWLKTLSVRKMTLHREFRGIPFVIDLREFWAFMMFKKVLIENSFTHTLKNTDTHTPKNKLTQ